MKHFEKTFLMKQFLRQHSTNLAFIYSSFRAIHLCIMYCEKKEKIKTFIIYEEKILRSII